MPDSDEMNVDLGGGRQRSVKPNYPSNSHISKSDDAVPEKERKIEKITTGEVVQRKKPLGKRIAETFTGEDARSTGQFILFEVIVPAIKDLFVETVKQGIERAIYGDSRPMARSPHRSGGYTNYNKMHESYPSSRRAMSQQARATHNFDEIVVETRGEAQDVLDRLSDIIDEYQFASVSDLYELVGLSDSYTDRKWGWTNLRTASISRLGGGGYLLNLPRPIPAD